MKSSTTTSDAPTSTTVALVEPADVIFTGGTVVTMDPEIGTVEAIAISGDTIAAVGSAEDIARYKGLDTVVIDLDGRTVSPGFVDAHTHILTDMGGIENGQALALANGITSLADLSVEQGWPERFIEAARSGVLRVRTSMYLSPIAEMFSLVTRGRVADDGSICEAPDWMADGGVTVEEGLAMMTTGSAYAIRQEDVVGSLTPGRFVDIVVLTDNLLTIPPQALPVSRCS